eukprot:SAG11_NODE_3_length_39220_cov_67.005828_8_plen_161_part_00
MHSFFKKLSCSSSMRHGGHAMRHRHQILLQDGGHSLCLAPAALFHGASVATRSRSAAAVGLAAFVGTVMGGSSTLVVSTPNNSKGALAEIAELEAKVAELEKKSGHGVVSEAPGCEYLPKRSSLSPHCDDQITSSAAHDKIRHPCWLPPHLNDRSFIWYT